GGYRWAINPSAALGDEVGYNDLGNIHAKNIFQSGPVIQDDKSQLHGWTAGVNGHFNFNPNWYVSARGGLYSWTGHGLNNDVNPIRKGLDDTSWYAGAGVGYDFSNNVSLGINYDHYDASKQGVNLGTNLISVSAEYRFCSKDRSWQRRRAPWWRPSFVCWPRRIRSGAPRPLAGTPRAGLLAAAPLAQRGQPVVARPGEDDLL